jgi:hypothetical protein
VSTASKLHRMQRGLEAMYRVETGVAVDDFVIDAAAREAVSPTRTPREQLLVADDGGELSIGLFLDDDARPARTLGDFLLALEGVSHFVYAIVCARGERRVSALELELQAEVDKYVTCVLHGDADAGGSARWRRRLFEEIAYEPDLDDDEAARYRAANQNAMRYATSLERRFVATRRVPEMLGELRRFYRLGLADKLAHIAHAA